LIILTTKYLKCKKPTWLLKGQRCLLKSLKKEVLTTMTTKRYRICSGGTTIIIEATHLTMCAPKKLEGANTPKSLTHSSSVTQQGAW
jgi:hypothetical protein